MDKIKKKGSCEESGRERKVDQSRKDRRDSTHLSSNAIETPLTRRPTQTTQSKPSILLFDDNFLGPFLTLLKRIESRWETRHERSESFGWVCFDVVVGFVVLWEVESIVLEVNE